MADSTLYSFFCGALIVLSGCSAGSGANSTISNSSSLGGAASGSGGAASGSLGGAGTMQPSLGGAVLGSDELGGAGGRDPSKMAITDLPAGFTATEIGGFQLGAKLVDGAGGGVGAGGSGGSGGGGGGGMGDCGNILLSVVRDFKGADEAGNADFEADGIQGADVTPNLVSPMLGADRKPVYASQCDLANQGGQAVCPYGRQTSNQANFDEWYRTTPGKNEPYLVSLWMEPLQNGLFTFQSLNYFPIDAVMFSAQNQGDDGMQHNFAFTTEIHTQFLYRGGETFTFEGDDDVWVYINGKLAVDVGGLHPMQERQVVLDTAATQLGIVKGTIYPLDFFHAERHTGSSTFRIDTNLSFVDCGTVIPDVVK